MNNSLDDYFAALERLKVRKPLRVPKGTRITKDSVSLEAGRGKGSIKKSRPIFAALIAAIEGVGSDQSEPEITDEVRLQNAKTAASRLRKDLDSALAREVSLVVEVYKLKRELAALTGKNVLPLRPQLERAPNVKDS